MIHRVAFALLLAGCAAVPPPAGPQFDGTYAGHTALTRGWGYVCGTADLPQTVTVRDGRFDYPFQGYPPYVVAQPVQIAANGTFQLDRYYWVTDYKNRTNATQFRLTIAGGVAGDTLEVTETDLRCTRHSVLQRR